METTVKERLTQFIESKNISKNKFEKVAGLSTGYLNQLRRAPGTDKLMSILKAFPDLNQDWLLTGNGPMILGDVSGNVVNGVTQGDNSTINNGTVNASDECAVLRAQIASLQEQVEYLKAQCEGKDKERERLMTMIETLIAAKK